MSDPGGMAAQGRDGAGGETEITVKPHMVERVVPSYWHVFEERRMPERTVTERGEGFVAEWPAERLRSWGRTRAGAVSMLETMLSARRRGTP